MSTLTHDHSPPTLSNSEAVPTGPLSPIRHWFDRIEIRSSWLAHLVCRLIPCTCPFEHKFTLFGHFFHTPPLCELNPFYNEFVALRFRALSYLGDVCGEDVTRYIC